MKIIITRPVIPARYLLEIVMPPRKKRAFGLLPARTSGDIPMIGQVVEGRELPPFEEPVYGSTPTAYLR